VKQETKDSTLGRVISRDCPLCGHHEIGFVTQDGEFHSLRPGTIIQVLESSSPAAPFRDTLKTPISTEKDEQGRGRLWAPEPLGTDSPSHTASVKEHLLKGGMSGGLYELAYVERLERLIDKVLDVPLPAILDRFFNAPQLASGTSAAVVMYREWTKSSGRQCSYEIGWKEEMNRVSRN
jgi:hypothetical protein